MVEQDNCSPRVLQKLVCDFLVSIEPKGFLCCLGIRRTIGSYENCLPPDRRDLEYMFNKLNKILPEKEYHHNPNPPIITVGARALQKHASRNGPVTYWLGKQQMDGMTEQEKNQKADQLCVRLLNACQWLNVMTLCPASKDLILEIRDCNGYGARWEVDNQFRGLIEP